MGLVYIKINSKYQKLNPFVELANNLPSVFVTLSYSSNVGILLKHIPHAAFRGVGCDDSVSIHFSEYNMK